MSNELRILVTGGGTGGHTVPAIATVDAIKKLVGASYPDLKPIFLYVGSEKGLEAQLASKAHIRFVAIATGKLRRSANPLRMLSLANIRDALRVPLGFLQALQVVARFRPNVVFSTGGYVSVPAVFAAGVLNRPVLMHEQTVQIGLANRWCARIARKIALSYCESANELSPADRQKTFVTGGVVRSVVLGGSADAARQRFGFTGENTQLPVVYVTGGAQGSSIINRSVLECLAELLDKCCIIHQCGRQKARSVQDETKLKRAVELLSDDKQSRYFVTPFVGDEIGDVYALADIIVGRSGAGTVSELCAVGKPAILIPLMPTGGDEQTRNAQRLVGAGAAETIRQSELTGQLLAERILALLDDPERRAAMGAAALKEATPDAVDRLAKAVVALALGADESLENL